MSDLVFIHADESCLGKRRDYWISEPATTNNRMALRSAIEPLLALKRPCRIRFTSDSQYLVKGMSEWVHGWIRRGWRRKGGEIENVELWQALVDAAERHDVRWHWVRGHAGHARNEYANHLAIAAANSLTESGGLVPSSLDEWLMAERDAGRYLDFDDFAGPIGDWPDVALVSDG